MKKYIFEFGRNFNLSLAEIISYFRMKNLEFEIKEINKEGCLISISKFNPLEANKRLAGTRRIAKVITESLEEFQGKEIYKRPRDKFFYHIKNFGNSELKRKLKTSLKQKFRAKNLKAMYKNMDLSEIIKKNALEILIFGKNKFWIGKTISISNPLDFKERDVKRPNKDREINTSIRIADILLNLGQMKKNETLLDPFCGVGTILQEGLLFGAKVKGIDIKRSRVEKAKENLEWFSQEYDTNQGYEIKTGDSRKISKYFDEKSADVVVSEPELGPLLKSLPRKREAKKIIKKLNEIYSPFFKEINEILKSNGRMVIILPRIRTNHNGTFEIDIKNLLNETNLNFFDNFDKIEGLGLKLPLVYSESWHKIERLIYIFRKE